MHFWVKCSYTSYPRLSIRLESTTTSVPKKKRKKFCDLLLGRGIESKVTGEEFIKAVFVSCRSSYIQWTHFQKEVEEITGTGF